MTDASLSTTARHAAYSRLIEMAGRSTGEQRWQQLMAAHVIGQHVLRLHFDSHWRMLRQALSERDSAEAAGQLLRLALVPIGHAASRLPAGNIGRATVSAFRPMVPPPAVQRWMQWAVRGGEAQAT